MLEQGISHASVHYVIDRTGPGLGDHVDPRSVDVVCIQDGAQDAWDIVVVQEAVAYQQDAGILRPRPIRLHTTGNMQD